MVCKAVPPGRYRIPHISPSSSTSTSRRTVSTLRSHTSSLTLVALSMLPPGSRNYTTFTYGTAVGFTGGLVLTAYASPPDCAAANPAKLLQVGPRSGPDLAHI